MRNRFTLFFLLLLGIGLRLVLFLSNPDSFDSQLWMEFGRSISEVGLSQSYREVPLLNHPPGISWFASLLYSISKDWGFGINYWCRFFSLLADAGIMWLLIGGKSWGADRLLPRYLLSSVVPIVVFGFGNTDLICIFFIVWAMASVASSERFMKSGVMFGIALNIKLLPVFLLPAFVKIAGNLKSRAQFLLGLMVASIPWFVFAYLDFEGLFKKVLNYIPALKFRWGMPVLLQGTPMEAWYYFNGKYVALTAVVIVCITFKVKDKHSIFHLVFLSSVVFLLLAPAVLMYYLAYLYVFMLLAGLPFSLMTEILLAGLLFCYINSAAELIYLLPQGTLVPLTSSLTVLLYSLLLYVAVRVRPRGKSY